MARLSAWIRYRKGDPLRDLHVPKRERLDSDEGPASDASNDPEIGFDREAVRQDMTVVPEEELQ